MNRFLSFFRPPIYPDLESSQKAAFLQYTYLVVAPGFLIFGILNIGWGAYELGYTLIGFGFICLAGLYLNRKMYYYPAAILLSGIIFLGTFYNLIDGAAFHDPGVAALPIFVLFTGIFFKKRHVHILVVLSILALIAIYYGWELGFLELSTPPNQGRLIILCILQLISGALTWMIISTYQRTVSTLNVSEERYRDLVENLQDLVYRYDFLPERGFSYVSPSAAQITGYSPEEHYADPDLGFKLIHPEDRELFEQLTSTDGFPDHPLVFRWIKKDGTVIWTEQRNNPVLNEDGDLIAIEGIARDITTEKNANDMLRESAERNRAFFEESPLLNWQYTLDPPMPMDLPIEEQIDWILHKSILTDVNIEHALTQRPSEGEVTGQTLYRNWGESDAFGKPILQDFIAGNYNLQMYETQEETIEDPVWSLINAFGVIEDGHLVRLWGTTLDITERKKAEETLKERSEWNRVFFEESHSHNFQYSVDPPMPLDLPIEDQIKHILNHARITSSNQAYAETLGVTLDDLYGTTLLESYGGSDQYGIAVVQEYINQGYLLKNYESHESNMKGDMVWSIINASSLIEDDHLIAIWGTSLDITEQKQAETELRESEEKFQKVFMASPYAISIIRIADGTIVDVNQGFLENTGYKHHELIGRTPEDIGLIKYPINSDQLRELIETRGLVLDQEVELIHKDGHVINSIFSSAEIDLDNEPHRVSIGLDVTRLRESERALEESDIRNRLILQSLPMAFYRAQAHGDLSATWVSEQIDNISGFTPQDMTQPGFWSSRLHPDDREEAINALLNSNGERFIIREYRWQKPDESYIWIQDNAVILLDNLGTPQELIGTWTEITDRKIAEHILLESEERYRTLFESSPDAVMIFEENRVSYCNSSTLDVFGYPWTEMIGKHPGDLSPEFQSDGTNSYTKANQLIQLAEGGVAQSFEWEHTHKSGNVFQAEVLLNRIIIQDEAHTFAIVRDITARKRADDVIRASEERYRTLFTSAADGISIHEGDTFIDVNKAWIKMFGYDRDQALGKTPFDYSPTLQPDGRISSEKGWEYIHAAQAGTDQLFSWRHIRSDGTEFDAEIFMTVIELAGEEVMISFVRDLTERKQAEAAALEERQRLAHELHDAVSQTLFSASMISQTLERNWEKNPDLVKDNLSELQILTQGALAEMRNLLVELRPGSLEHTPMPELLQQLVDGFSGRTKTAIDLEIQEHNPLPSDVRFVFFRLAQESLNNIIKHARANSVQVIFSSQADQAQLTVKDDGQGFDPSKITPGHHGLEIMKERAGLINADININSEVGKGTSVSVNWKP